MVLVDSSVWIESERLRGRLDVKMALNQLLSRLEAALCSPVRLEVLGGARPARRGPWEACFAVLPYLPVHEGHWRRALQLSWQLGVQGRSIPWNDLLVASVALDRNLRVYSLDAHFEWMAKHAGLRLYQPGPAGQWQPDE